MEATIQNVLNEQNGSSFVGKLVDDANTFTLVIESVLLDKSAASSGEYKDEGRLDSRMNHSLVLNIYEKLAASLEDPAAQEYTHELQNEYILVGATLFDLALVYGRTHPDHVRTLLSNLCTHAPWLLSEIEASSDLLVDQISQFRDMLNECSKSRLAEDPTRLIESMCANLELQTSIATSWLYLAAFCKHAAKALSHDDRLIVELAKTWDAVSEQTVNVRAVVNQDQSEAGERFEKLAKELKWNWSGLVFCTLQEFYTHSKPNGHESTRFHAPDMAHHTVFLDILNVTEAVEAPLTPFVNSPFLLDMEFRFGFRKFLAENASMDTAQLDYLVVSIEQLVGMTEPLYRNGFHSLNELVSHMQHIDLTADSSSSNPQRGLSRGGDKGDKQIEDPMAIAQIRELLPDLGAGFICACLYYYGQNVEAVIGAILEDNLPSDIASMDRASETWAPPRDHASDDSVTDYSISSDSDSDVQPAAGVLESRRNIFDNDEFDIFNRDSLDWSRVSKGKTQKPVDVNTPDNQLKSRIMEIAQRMDQEDEYDDTYDETAQDGAVDTLDVDDLTTANTRGNAEGSKRKEGANAREASADPTKPWEEVLVRQFISDPKVLERNGASRKLPGRQALRTQTGLSDEQLEGWYIMFQRNPRQKSVLSKYEHLGNQNRIGAATLASDTASQPPSREFSQKQPVNPKTSAPNYNKKNRNKAKIANHNRKQQHDRKTRQNMLGSNTQPL
ncbi:hypothetical protein EV175_001395 [Coemansia sp. RSA 1933]|nr:hypothetical protein EV175_001395 [Coemansia sp. RSA 1933]